MPIFLDDRPLLDAFRQGAAHALRRVYDFYLDDVMRLVRYGFVSGAARVPGEPQRSKQLDLAHDVFTKAFAPKARDGYDGLRHYRPYLLRIGKNLLIDRARRAGRELTLGDLDDDALPAPQDERSREEQLHFERLRQVTVEYLQSCDEKLRRFVALRYEAGASQYEVAREMGITRRRARTLEKRAREGLRAHLEAKKLL